MKRIIFTILGIILSVSPIFAHIDQLSDKMARLEQAKKSKNRDSLAIICADLSDYYVYRNNDSLLHYAEMGLKYADKNSPNPYLRLLSNIGCYYNATGESHACVEKHLFALREAQRVNASELTLGDICSSLGVSYRRIDKTDSAALCYRQALTHYDAAGDEGRDEIPFLLTNMAILYTNTHRLDEAEHYIRQALERSGDNCDLPTRLYLTTTAGSIFSLQNKNLEAISLLEEALRKAQEADMPRFVMQCMTPLLVLLSKTDNRTAFEDYSAEAQKWIRRLPPESNEVTGYHEVLAAAYARQKQYAKSNDHYRRLIQLHKVNAHAPLTKLHLYMARNYSHMQRPDKAYSHYEQVIAIIDSLRSTEIDRQMSELNIRYATQEKELELAQLTHQYLTHKNKVMQWSILGIIILAVSISLLIYESFRRKQQQHQEEMNVARSFIDGLEQERTRISKELHDGVSNDLLGAGLMLRLLDEKPEIRKDVMESIEMIRNEVRTISHELNQPRFQNATLDEVAENMLSQIGSGESMHITFRKTGTSDEWKHIPHDVALEIYRILQELMTNIVRHSDATRADISLDVAESSLVLHITNDGKAYDPSASNSDGIGCYTIEDRVKTIGAQFDTQITEGSQHYMLSVGWKPRN